jgi:hypothetical protein
LERRHPRRQSRRRAKGQGTTSGNLIATTDYIHYAEGFEEHEIDVTVTASWVPSAELEAEAQARYDATQVQPCTFFLG